jgi:hypothetical protein
MMCTLYRLGNVILLVLQWMVLTMQYSLRTTLGKSHVCVGPFPAACNASSFVQLVRMEIGYRMRGHMNKVVHNLLSS